MFWVLPIMDCYIQLQLFWNWNPEYEIVGGYLKTVCQGIFNRLKSRNNGTVDHVLQYIILIKGSIWNKMSNGLLSYYSNSREIFIHILSLTSRNILSLFRIASLQEIIVKMHDVLRNAELLLKVRNVTVMMAMYLTKRIIKLVQVSISYYSSTIINF